MSRAEETNRRLRESILDLLSLGALYGIGLSAEQIFAFIPQKASLVGVKTHLNLLIKRGKIKQFKNQHYGIKKTSYPTHTKSLQPIPSRSVQRLSKLLSVIPFVKAVVLSSDTVLGTEKPSLIVVTTPNRIYITKDILSKIQKTLGQNKPIGDIDCNIFYTTAGIRFSSLMAQTDLHTTLWFICANPIYGKKTWYGLLKNDKLIHGNLVNYAWPRQDVRIQTSTNKQLDNFDNKRYRHYLKQMSQIKDFQRSSSLLRVRPDVFIARKLHNDKIKNDNLLYKQIRDKL